MSKKKVTLFRLELPATKEGIFSNYHYFRKIEDDIKQGIQDNLRQRLLYQPTDTIPTPGDDFSSMLGYNNMSSLRNSTHVLSENNYDLFLKFDDMINKCSTKYACSSIDQLAKWVHSDKNLKDLLLLGYELIQFEVSVEDCLILPKQVMYKHNDELKVRKLHLFAKLKDILTHYTYPFRKKKVIKELSSKNNNFNTFTNTDRDNFNLEIAKTINIDNINMRFQYVTKVFNTRKLISSS